MNDKVRSHILANQRAFIEDLSTACRIPSVFGNDAALHEMADWLTARLRQAGCQVEQWPLAGGPPVVWGEIGAGERSLLSYSHYDVQPADPLNLWDSPAFEPVVREGKLFARGVSDDKGDVMSRIHAVETYQAIYGELPLRFKFFVEGEEEIGSPNLAPAAATHAAQLQADGCLWESGGFDNEERYTIYLGVKGMLYVELRAGGAVCDLHSAYAPVVTNPAWRLVQALNTLRSADGVITIDGFVEHVRPPTPAEESYLDHIPFEGAARKAQWGLQQFEGGVDDREALKRFLFAPTCNICGIYSGFIDAGQKTVLPNAAMAKLDLRLVPNLTPELVLDLLRRHLDRRGFDEIEVVRLGSLSTSRANPQAEFVQTVTSALADVYGHQPVVYPSHGGSGPMYPLAEGLGMDAVTVGVGYAGVNMHAPNENIRVDDYLKHVEFLVELFRRFGS
ncbi:MAG: M20/M25/M40 family metallo-hydrolase [Caldilineales bacterium]|nr:M20/M25/M40 family metallo-hydrolase [Caldilineales bacterium]